MTTTLRPVRERVAECAKDAGLADDRAPNLMLAASEVAANTPRNTADGGTLPVKQRETGPLGHIPRVKIKIRESRGGNQRRDTSTTTSGSSERSSTVPWTPTGDPDARPRPAMPPA